jgi:hypothetical protein
MALAELTIFDVGHGICAVLLDADGVGIFDAPTGETLLKTLK